MFRTGYRVYMYTLFSFVLNVDHDFRKVSIKFDNILVNEIPPTYPVLYSRLLNIISLFFQQDLVLCIRIVHACFPRFTLECVRDEILYYVIFAVYNTK